ncbi:MAG: phosphatidate cytidylyltransferase [Dehalococcoidales bacterium]|nr:phosphatidate cytidylyltransferase [Dehalococcoidales bacterium]
MLKKRVITSLWLAPLAMAAVWFGDMPLLVTFLVAALGLITVLEFYRMAEGVKAKPQIIFGAIFTLVIILLRDPKIQDYVNQHYDINLALPTLLTAGLLISLASLLSRPQKFGALPGWAWTWAGVFYIGWLLGFITPLRFLDDGRNWLYLALFCTFSSDTFAFFVGRACGKHKLAPSISPAKTWEGAIGGLLGAAAMSLVFLLPTPLSLTAHLNWWQALTLGALVSVFAQCGDLVESLLKRNTGVKDSGTIFPGHGGALDRIDGVIFAVVLVYYWVVLVPH